MKTCRPCGQAKPLDEFHNDKNRKDGKAVICKLCAREKARAWFAENKERANANSRRNYVDHTDEYKARAADWAANNRERRREIVRAWDKRNADRKKANGRDRQAQWRAENPELARIIGKQNAAIIRARRAGCVVEPVDYVAVAERDNYVCHICSQATDGLRVDFDHVIPLSRGGPHSFENVAVSHSGCNRWKRDRLTSELPTREYRQKRKAMIEQHGIRIKES